MYSLTLVLLLASAYSLTNGAGCPGCTSPVENPNSDQIRKLMSSTLSKTNAGYTITNIKNCKSQVVAGIKYDCEVDIKSPSGVPATCRLVVVEKPWDKNNKEQIVEETCSSVSRTKRAACPGCPEQQDANSASMKKKLSGVLSQTNSGLSLVRGNQCTSQVVAGIKYDCTLQVESPQTNGVQTCKLSFVEQPWISPDPQILQDTCSQLVRNKREVCAGCPVQQDANSASMKKKLSGVLSQTNSGLSLVRGTHCSSQVVAGIKYVCTLEVESPKTNGVQTCKLSFLEQPWISPDPQVLEDTCSQLVRNKREICAGCPVEQDPKDAEMKKKISNTLKQTNSGLGLVNVEKCTSQVVAGALYKCTIQVDSPNFNGVQTCQLEILEQPWISKEPQIVKDTCSQLGRAKRDNVGGLKEVDSSERVLVEELATFAVNTLDDIDADSNKRLVTKVVSAHKQVVKSECEPISEVTKVGGYEPVKTNGDEVQKAAKFAANRISEGVNSIYVKKIISIERAATQIVAGVNYAMTLVLGDTDCMKNKVNENSVCKLLPHAKSNLVCEVVVYEKPWENSMKLTSSKCHDAPNVSVQRAKRTLLGGFSPVETNDDDVQAAAHFAEEEINKKVNSVYVKKVVAVEKAQQQIVAGTNYALTLRLRDTDCRKNKQSGQNSCHFLPNTKMDLLCQVTVYQDLSNVMHLSNMQCEDVATSPSSAARNRRSTVGGYKPIKTNSDNVQKAAQFAESKINNRVNSIYIKKISSIEKAESQVVAGTNYALTLKLEDTDCMKNRPYINSDCQPLSDARMDLLCSVVVYKDLQNEFTMTKFNCEDVPKIPNNNPRNKRAVLGGASKMDVNSSEVVSLLPYLSREATQRTNSPTLMRATKVVSVTKQVVAGMKYNLRVEFSSTECPAAVNAEPATCHIPDNAMKHICDISVWTKPWMNFVEVSEMSCQQKEEGEEIIDGLADVELERLAAVLETTVNDPDFHQFATFLASFDKYYPTESEYRKRFRVFRANMKKVKYLQETEQGTGQYGATQFADLTKAEFKKHYLGLKVEHGRWPQRPQAVIPNVTLPAEYDWRDYGAVTPVKNQGLCGSCWAFSITGNIEGQYAIKNKKLLSLSEQELVDCDKYDAGCNGGFFDSAFHALEDLGGLETESDYPYEGYDDKCRFNSSKVKVSISGSLNISHNENDMAKWLYKNGPITVAVNANAMQFYMGGVSHPLKFLCSPDNLDHGVLIVGYGVHTTTILKRQLPYWIVKNSWGGSWGKQGYYWLYRGDGSCGINQMPTSAIL